MKKATPKPQTVNICGLTYTIERVPYKTPDEFMSASIFHEEQKIYVNDAVSDEKAKMALLHELIHGILSNGCFERENQDEILVQHLATELYQSFRSCPELILAE